MSSLSTGRVIFRWFTPSKLLSIVVFVIIAMLAEFAVVSSFVGGLPVEDAIVLPFTGWRVSPLRHLLPLSIVVVLTANFVHLTASVTLVHQRKRKTRLKEGRRGSGWKPLAKVRRRVSRVFGRVKDRIAKTSFVAWVGRRIQPANPYIVSAITITVVFIALVILIIAAAFPGSVSRATAGFFDWAPGFVDFVLWTAGVTEWLAGIPGIGSVAVAVHQALIGASPGFHNALKGLASTIAEGLVALSSTEKYLLIQNSTALLVTAMVFLYSRLSRMYRVQR
ncbi:MAG: hypothetical protein JSV35_01775 [Candidatus Bathyarchaeota archaeon]|nr:MAG: hypothetical protein JSV35_01775 [Candidatus Bathyarchaeota archaeon]